MTDRDEDAHLADAAGDVAPPASLRRPRQQPRAPAPTAEADLSPAAPASRTAASVAPLVRGASDRPHASGYPTGAPPPPTAGDGRQAARRTRAREIVTAAGWALAALLAVLLALRPAPFAPPEPSLPPYHAALRGGAIGASAGPGGPAEVILRPGDILDITLRPATRVGFYVRARAYLVRGDEVRPWAAPVRLDGDGGAHVAGVREALFAGVPAGAWEIVVAIGRAEALPASPEALAAALRAGDAAGRGYRLARGRVILADAGPR